MEPETASSLEPFAGEETMDVASINLPLPNHALSLTGISKLSSANSQHKRHKIYTGSGHHCGIIPYSGVVWWITSRADDE